MIDLDYFKKINDTYGHQEGDRILTEAATCLRGLCREEDIAGRLGGDEFCIYFHGMRSMDRILDCAEKICEAIRKMLPKKQNGVSCSIGIVRCMNPQLTFEEVYEKADKALYEQKKRGRNGYTIAKNERD